MSPKTMYESMQKFREEPNSEPFEPVYIPREDAVYYVSSYGGKVPQGELYPFIDLSDLIGHVGDDRS